jgi:hypothetical protein
MHQITSAKLGQIKPNPLFRRDAVSLDQYLPEWARRSNPIVRRHLGVFWKMMPMELEPLARIAGLQLAWLLISIPVPFLFDFSLLVMFTLIPVSISLIPLTLIFYCRLLFDVGYAALKTIIDEQRNDTLQLLLTTPFTLSEIIASKVAAGIWRRVEDLGVILLTVALLSMPLIAMQFSRAFPLDEQPHLLRAALFLTYTASLLRMVIEPVMVGMLGLMLGAAIPSRTTAVISLILLLFFYFLLINLPRLLVVPWPIQFFIEGVLPVAVPSLIAYGAYRMALRLLKPD